MRVKRFVVILLLLVVLGSGETFLRAQTPRTKVTLISELEQIEPGKSFQVGIRLRMPKGVHTYWVNPGETGLATEVIWKLPPGFTVSPLEWPVPQRIDRPQMVTFEYEDEVVLLAKITPDPTLKTGRFVRISGEVRWLECEENCLPGRGLIQLDLRVGEKAKWNSKTEILSLFKKFEQQIPRETKPVFVDLFPDRHFRLRADIWGVKSVVFFPRTSGKLNLAVPFLTQIGEGKVEIQGRFEEISDHLSGVLVINEGASQRLYQFESAVTPVLVATKKEGSPPTLAGVLLFAFLGGLILNLMPCVLPVLSLKILGFVNDAERGGEKVWHQGVAFTGGVLVSFWILTGFLVTLRLGGEGLGWGFQLQSPGFVLGLTLFFLAMTLNLFGVFEIGTSWISMQNQVSGKEGWIKSFGSGVLATLVATPCSAPFMGVAVGYALSQSLGITFLVMTFLGSGVAAPYLLLSLNPDWIRKIPKPGEWMIGFKQFLGFLMLGTVLWLIWVYAQLQGVRGLGSVLLVTGSLSFLIWGWGRSRRGIVKVFLILLMLVSILISISEEKKDFSERYSGVRLSELRKQGRPVFVDFTAAWCLTCQANKKFVLHRDEIQAEFRSRGVIVMEADWTNSDPEITKVLEGFGRASVPFYLLYGKDSRIEPQILPEILTKEILLNALRKID